jgi:hypothetical protein
VDGRPTITAALLSAHRAVADQLESLEDAPVSQRRARVEALHHLAEATAEAEEAVLFPAVGRILGDNVLVDACAADHRDVHDRLETLASRPEGAGFAGALGSLATDIRHHLEDETESLLPVLDEALDRDESERLAAEFAAIVRARQQMPRQ